MPSGPVLSADRSSLVPPGAFCAVSTHSTSSWATWASQAAGGGMLAGMANLVAVTLITGEEEFLADRALREAAAQARAALAEASGTPDGGDLHDLEASALSPGELATLTSPSLFGGGAVVIVRNAQNAAKEIAAELTRYAAVPAADAAVIVTHAGGAKGKALV